MEVAGETHIKKEEKQYREFYTGNYLPKVKEKTIKSNCVSLVSGVEPCSLQDCKDQALTVVQEFSTVILTTICQVHNYCLH